jgi:hypothetical protein
MDFALSQIYMPDENKRLPIHFAAAMGHFDLISALIDGARDNPADKLCKLYQPDDLLRDQWLDRWRDPTKELKDGVADMVNSLDTCGWTPIALAVHHGHLRCVQVLLDHEAKPLKYRDIEHTIPRENINTGGGSDIPPGSIPCAYDIGVLRLSAAWIDQEKHKTVAYREQCAVAQAIVARLHDDTDVGSIASFASERSKRVLQVRE